MIEATKLKNYLALLRAKNFSTREVNQYIASNANQDGLLELPDSIKIDDKVAIDLAWLQAAPNRYIINQFDTRYPPLLRLVDDAPPLLFIEGNIHALQTVQLAIVGSRNPTLAGKNIAKEFARSLGTLELTITSGLALGIDTAAHEGALDANGLTIAVLANGLASVYPPQNANLKAKILANNGAIVSEMPTDYPPLAKFFPRRNRIISALSLGVLVVEAVIKSGSLITARYALEQNREVFAIPGSIHNPQSKGCHQLIRQGAKLVESVHDIIEELQGVLQYKQPKSNKNSYSMPALSKEQEKLLLCLSTETTSVDAIIAHSGFKTDIVNAILAELEIDGFISQVPGGFVRNFA